MFSCTVHRDMFAADADFEIWMRMDPANSQNGNVRMPYTFWLSHFSLPQLISMTRQRQIDKPELGLQRHLEAEQCNMTTVILARCHEE